LRSLDVDDTEPGLTIVLKPAPATLAIALSLEDRGFIRLMRPGTVTARVAPDSFTIDEWYRFPEPCRLADVGINWYHVRPAWHPPDQNELVMMLGGSGATKPLYFVFGLHSHTELERRSEAGTLRPEDFVLLDWPYDDAAISCFVIRAGVVHCEATTRGGGTPPHVFVVGPRDLTINDLCTGQYSLEIDC
jgi:hypothetical protein